MTGTLQSCKTGNCIVLLLGLLLSFLPSCRTMMLNQTAETLQAGSGESSFSLSGGVATNTLGTAGPYLQGGYRQRWGITGRVELQLVSDVNFFMSIHDVYDFVYLYARVNCDAGVKCKLFSIQGHTMALIPYAGIYGGFGRWWFRPDGFLGPYAGVKWVGSYRLARNSTVAFYYGLMFELSEDLLSLRHTIPAVSGGYQARAPLLDSNIGLVVGWQVYKSITSKKEKKYLLSFYHELGCTVSLNSSTLYDPSTKTVIDAQLQPVAITAFYSFSMGSEYGLIKRK
jgi:hypothetical protein